MLRTILKGIGFAKAPSPIRKFIGAKAFFGTMPALGYLAWRYRGKLKSLVSRARREPRGELTAHGERDAMFDASP